MDITQKLENYLNASYYCIAINTYEEARSIQAVDAVAKKSKKTVYTYSASEGILQGADVLADGLTSEFSNLLKVMIELPDDCVLILRDPPPREEMNSLTRRLLRDLIFTAPKKGSCVIIISPLFRPWAEIEKFVTIIEFTLPDKKDLEAVCTNVFNSLKDGPKDKVAAIKKSITPELIKSLSGLSSMEAENALALAWAETGVFDPQVIYREKVAAVKRTDLLEIVDPEPLGLGAIGGLGNLKEWIIKRNEAYSLEAEKYGLPTPKGILITGVPGTGKSLSARAIGTALGVPTLHLDIGKLFGGIVGETEQKTRDTLRLAEAISPCCLWIDEVEKALETNSSGGDSGVSRRLFGALLTWMENKKAPVFLVMTANEVWKLPAPFLRKGRFDELFAVDLPTKTERMEIASIVIAERGRDPKKFDLGKIAQATENFVGSEIKSVFADALYNVFAEHKGAKEPTTEDLVHAAQSIIPLSKTSSEDVQQIRNWAKGRAKMAGKPEQVSSEATTTRKINIRKE